MGRVRRKGKKLNVNHEDAVSGEDEKLPTQKRRGRPQKPLKDEFDDEEVEKVECLRVYVESAYYLVLFIQKKRHKEKVDSNVSVVSNNAGSSPLQPSPSSSS
ncbi:hypothetical protein S83_046901 [Arachis hypogaea]